MGFNTTVVILNDGLWQIEEDKDFGKNLVAAIMKKQVRSGVIYVPAGSHANPCSVVETHHADGLHAILVGGNTGYDLGRVGGYSLKTDEEEGKRILLKNLAHNFGFDISLKKRSK